MESKNSCQLEPRSLTFLEKARMMSQIKIRIFELPPIGTNAYLIINEDLGKAALFDSPFGAKVEVDKQLERHDAELDGVWLTHGHWDHILDVHEFNKVGVPIFAHMEDEVLIKNPELMASFSIPGIEYHPGKVDGYLEDGQEIEIVGVKTRVVHTPGHSPGSISFIMEDLNWVISGDVIFAGSVGRTDFPGCSHEALMESIRKQFFPLDPQMIIYPGHGPKTTVGQERSLNPFLSEM